MIKKGETTGDVVSLVVGRGYGCGEGDGDCNLGERTVKGSKEGAVCKRLRAFRGSLWMARRSVMMRASNFAA